MKKLEGEAEGFLTLLERLLQTKDFKESGYVMLAKKPEDL